MKKIISYIFLTLTLVLGCAFAVQAAETEHKPADIPGLTFDHSMELSYAKEFNVDYYNDGYALITIDQEGQCSSSDRQDLCSGENGHNR